jgi:hypothetical protein
LIGRTMNPNWPPGFLRPCPLSAWLAEHGPVVGLKVSGGPAPGMELVGERGTTRAATWSVIGSRRRGRPLQEGDLVLATKYSDGGPGDHFAVGFLAGIWRSGIGSEVRYDILDQSGDLFRYNGFRRVDRISPARATWLVERFKVIELGCRSVWWWRRAPMREAA